MVRKSLAAVEVFSSDLAKDLGDGGFRNWKHDLPDEIAASEVADYIVGVTGSIATHLQSLAIGYQNFKDARGEMDDRLISNLGSTGQMFVAPHDFIGREKQSEIDSRVGMSLRGIFISLGSVLDCLAGCTVGIAGIDVDVFAADIGLFRPIGKSEGYPAGSKLIKGLAAEGSPAREEQLKLIKAVGAALRQSGPTGWLEWAIGMRNMMVHRELRATALVVGSISTPNRIGRWPVANPNLSNLKAMRQAPDQLRGYYLQEDMNTTLKGIIRSIDAATTAAIGAIEHLWALRKQDLELIRQPARQWREPRESPNFAGYDPGSVELPGNPVLVMHPDTWERLVKGGVGVPSIPNIVDG